MPPEERPKTRSRRTLHAPFVKKYIPGCLVELLQTASALQDFLHTDNPARMVLLHDSWTERAFQRYGTFRKRVHKLRQFMSANQFLATIRCSIGLSVRRNMPHNFPHSLNPSRNGDQLDQAIMRPQGPVTSFLNRRQAVQHGSGW